MLENGTYELPRNIILASVEYLLVYRINVQTQHCYENESYKTNNFILK